MHAEVSTQSILASTALLQQQQQQQPTAPATTTATAVVSTSSYNADQRQQHPDADDDDDNPIIIEYDIASHPNLLPEEVAGRSHRFQSSSTSSHLRSISPVSFDGDDDHHDDSAAVDKDVLMINHYNTNQQKEGNDDKHHALLLQQLKERLLKLKKNYEMEKDLRKRKEKALVKLAKELNRRTADAASKEKKIVEMSQSIRCLESELELSHTNLVDARDKLEMEHRANHEIVARLEREAARSRHDLLKVRLQNDRLLLHGSSSNKNRLLLVRSLFPLLFAVAALAVAVIMGRFFDLNSMCAPIAPGTTLHPVGSSGSRGGDRNNDNNNVNVLEAPWWAPTSAKTATYALFCSSTRRPRTSYIWTDSDQFSIFRKDDEETDSNHLVWRGRVTQVRSDAIRVTLVNKKGTIEEIPAPWAV